MQALLKLPGLVLDDAQAKLTGKWTVAGNPALQPCVASGYRYEFSIEKAGDYEVLSYSPHENRATNTRVKPPLPQNFISLGTFKFAPGKPTDGNVHADAVQLLPK